MTEPFSFPPGTKFIIDTGAIPRRPGPEQVRTPEEQRESDAFVAYFTGGKYDRADLPWAKKQKDSKEN